MATATSTAHLETSGAVETPGATASIVFDEACRFCQRQIAWIQRRDRAGVFNYVPRQTPDLLTRFPVLAQHDLSQGMRLVQSDGRVAVGADAVYTVARRLRGWRYVALLYRVPGLHRLFRALYGWVAANRYRLARKCDDGCSS